MKPDPIANASSPSAGRANGRATGGWSPILCRGLPPAGEPAVGREGELHHAPGPGAGGGGHVVLVAVLEGPLGEVRVG